MEDLIALVIYAAIFVVLLGGGFAIGRWNESMHLRRLDEHENALSSIMVSDLRRLPANWRADQPTLVTGTAVIATDYFKNFAAGLRNLFGGEVRGYGTLVNRARREAKVRMLSEARAAGANAVWNVRFETSTIGGRNGMGGVEVLCYGTAMRVK